MSLDANALIFILAEKVVWCQAIEIDSVPFDILIHIVRSKIASIIPIASASMIYNSALNCRLQKYDVNLGEEYTRNVPRDIPV